MVVAVALKSDLTPVKRMMIRLCFTVFGLANPLGSFTLGKILPCVSIVDELVCTGIGKCTVCTRVGISCCIV